MRRLNQKGFGASAIVLVVVAVVAGAGYYVWYSQNKSKKADDTSQTNATQPTQNTGTEGWVNYSNTQGRYSFTHPSTWVQSANPELCSPGLALFGVNAASVGKCGSGSGGQMVFIGLSGEVNKEDDIKTDYYSDIKTENVTVNNVTGTKTTATAKDTSTDNMPSTLKAGTKIVRYRFVTGGQTYIATYYSANAGDDFPDALSDFNALMTTTFKFQP